MSSSDPACASQFCVTPVTVTAFTSTTYGIVLLAQLYTAVTCLQSRYCRLVRSANLVLLTSRIVWDMPEMALGHDGLGGWLRAFAMCLQVNAQLFIVMRWMRRTTKAAYNAVKAGSGQSYDDHPRLSVLVYFFEGVITVLFTMFSLVFRVSLFKPYCSAASLAMSGVSVVVSSVVVWSLVYTYRVVLKVAGRVAARQERMSAGADAYIKANGKHLSKLQKMIRYFRRVATFLVLWIVPLVVFCIVVFASPGSRDMACRTWLRIVFSCIHLFFVANIVVHTAITKDSGPGSSSTASASASGSGNTKSSAGDATLGSSIAFSVTTPSHGGSKDRRGSGKAPPSSPSMSGNNSKKRRSAMMFESKEVATSSRRSSLAAVVAHET